jgi:hypothetical protein
MHGGGPRCIYAIDTTDPVGWLASDAGWPQRLRREAEDRAFYAALGQERAEPRCASPGCSRGAISQSTLCRPHHFENVMRPAYPFAD